MATIRDRSLDMLVRLEHFYGTARARQWFEWRRRELRNRTPREAIEAGD
jgi:hypothetical protein